MMQEKRIVGALQAEQNAKAAQQAASQRAKDDFRAGEKAYDIAQASTQNTGSGKPLAIPVPVENRVTDKEREEAMTAYREGERNAVSIAEEYKSQVQEKQVESNKLNSSKPLYTLLFQDSDGMGFGGSHNFPRTPNPINLNDPRYDFNNPENWNPKYWNLNGIKFTLGWNSLYQNQKSLELGQPLPAPFTNYIYPHTNCSNFTSAGGYLAGNPFFSDPSAPSFYRTSENQYLYSLQHGEIRYRLNPAILPTSLQEPFQTNKAIFDLYKANPLAFPPGSIAYAKTGDVRSNGALQVNPTLLEWNFPNSFGHSFGIMSNGEMPVVAEMSGPWRYTPGEDGRYVGNLKPGEVERGNYEWVNVPDRIEMRSMFDLTYPWQTTVHGNPNGDYFEFHILTDLSIIPAQPITPDNIHLYGVDYELSENNKINIVDRLYFDNKNVEKECYINPATQDNLIQELYCPPAGTTIPNSTP